MNHFDCTFLTKSKHSGNIGLNGIVVLKLVLQLQCVNKGPGLILFKIVFIGELEHSGYSEESTG
jgi:hypothetical protein